jgi:acetoacetyl-CoA reductase
MAQRVALVTGGTGAIGTEICRQLAATGNKVAALGHPSDAGRIGDWLSRVRIDRAAVEVHLCDLSNFSAAQDAVRKLETLMGPADILVNAAGITRDSRLIKMTPQQWRDVIATNLDSVFNVTQPVFAGMCERGYGRIVNVSSVNGQKGQFGQANYSAAKAGMHGFTMAAAQEGAARGVTVNTVSPGYVETPMTAAIKPEALKKIVGSIPLGRMARPDEIARVVAFLCAEESGYITGANVPVNGGLFMSA